MKKFWLVIGTLVLVFSGVFSANADDLNKMLTKGKWVNKSDGYKISATNDRTVERYKSIRFNEDQTFVFDSIKTKFAGEWNGIDNCIYLEFNNQQINPKKATIVKEHLIIDGDEFKNYSGAMAGLLNFYEYTGVYNATPGHLLMIVVGIFFIFLAIRYNYEPLLLIPIGFGIIIGNIPFFQAEGFNLQLGIYEEGSVMN